MNVTLNISVLFKWFKYYHNQYQTSGQAARIEDFYRNFLSAESVVENKDDIESEHGFVCEHKFSCFTFLSIYLADN